MTTFVRNIERAVPGRAEPMLIVYRVPRHDSLLSRSFALSLIARDHPRRMAEFSIYEARLEDTRNGQSDTASAG